MCKFSLITVCLNPGPKLRLTLESALCQTYEDFEIILKDGGSTDGALEEAKDLLADPRIKLYCEKDTGIYDAMNQAVCYASGEYLFFLNAGDKLYDKQVLEQVAQEAETLGGDGSKKRKGIRAPRVLYGNVYSAKNQVWITPAPQITGFTCYRNVPCHQACFYSASLCKEKPFEPQYKIRGDYEHFLWCFYEGKADMQYLRLAVAEYEGGGYSETKENLKRSKREHREITKRYMSGKELFRYRMILALTLAPLRSVLAESPRFAGIYSRLVKKLYRK